MIRADLVVGGIRELATLAGPLGPRAGDAASQLGLLNDAAVAANRGEFVFVGSERELRRSVRLHSKGQRIDLGGKSVVPGFVDAHTHAIFAGDRANEVALKVRGVSYLEIARQGGGIYSTVRATRAASDRELIAQSLERIRRLACSGATTIEVKSGYALDHHGELRILRLLPQLAGSAGIRIVPTFLGAHAIPPEFDGKADPYVDQLIRKTIPEIARRSLAEFSDVFVEPGFFTAEQGERILRASQELGLGAKVHADEFASTGGAALAARIRAVSAEHLLETPVDDYPSLIRSGTIAVLLPVTPFASIAGSRSPGRAMVDAGVPVALGSDLSPNSYVTSMGTVLNHAVYSAKLTPSEAITALTVNAAYAVGLGGSAGTVEVGRPADLVAFDVPSVERIPQQMGLNPTAVFSRGKLTSSR